ncbi:MAG: hypothetical protein ACRCYO_14965, partial [Bacteroidia bacterium]
MQNIPFHTRCVYICSVKIQKFVQLSFFSIQIYVLLSLSVFGQRLDSAMLDSFGTRYYVPVDPFSLSPGDTNTTLWDFSRFPGLRQDTVNWSDANLELHQDSFPTASHVGDYYFLNINLLATPGNTRSFFTHSFLSNTDSGLFYRGTVVDSIAVSPSQGQTFLFLPQTSTVLPHAEMLIPYPLERYRQAGPFSYRQISTAIQNPGIQNRVWRFTRNWTREMVCDAAGAVITPLQRYDECLRLRTTLTETDSFFLWTGVAWRYEADTTISQTVYSWFSSDAGEVCRMVELPSGIALASYRGALQGEVIANFANPQQTVFENDGDVQIPVRFNFRRSMGAHLRYMVRAGSATQATDYQIFTDTLFVPADTFQTSISFRILDDLITEETEFVDIFLQDGNSGVSGYYDSIRVFIQDDDIPRARFVRTDTTVA